MVEKTPLVSAKKFPATALYTTSPDGYAWDLCIVINSTGDGDQHAKQLINDLNNVALETYQYYTVEKKEIICKVRAGPLRLSQHAVKRGQKMLLDPKRLQDAAEQGIRNAEGTIITQTIRITHNPNITPIEPYQFIYAQMQSPEDPRVSPLFAHPNGLSHPFSSALRVQLLLSIIQNDCGINLNLLSHKGLVKCYFPLRDESNANDLSDKWTSIKVM